MTKTPLIHEFLIFIRSHKKWWMILLLMLAASVALIAMMSDQSPAPPWLYPVR